MTSPRKDWLIAFLFFGFSVFSERTVLVCWIVWGEYWLFGNIVVWDYWFWGIIVFGFGDLLFWGFIGIFEVAVIITVRVRSVAA